MKIVGKLPEFNIPVLPLRNSVIFPGQTLPLVIGRAKSVKAAQAALDSGGWIFTVAQLEDNADETTHPDQLYRVATLSKIEKMKSTSRKSFQAIVTGIARYQIAEFKDQDDFLVASGHKLEDRLDVDGELATSLTQNMKDLAKETLDLMNISDDRLFALIDAIEDPVSLTHMVAQSLSIKTDKKQEVLEMLSVKERLLHLLNLLVQSREEIRLQKDVSKKINSRLGKQQKEVLLREQIRALQEELGDTAGGSGAPKDQTKKIDDAGMPEAVKKVALEQMARLESLGPQSPESSMIKNYLDLLCALPWSKSSDSDIDLEKARDILNEDHYGLDKIKKRIIQHLAVMKVKKDKKGSILLFVGPPGVGKTSLGRSIAKALGRKFVRSSLGGVRDDAEIRGHRRTYIGALPGRVIDGIKRAGENNPVFMLDEIDKLTRGYSGDPASALLEVLDPEQNSTFLDHYLDVPFDLSNVFFIATANSLETIPGPLLDRMEVIFLSGYTLPEKLHIAKTHLVPKVLDEHGMTREKIEIPEATLLRIISCYTREAGVRELQRMIAGTVRHGVEASLKEGAKLPVKIEIPALEEILGPERFQQESIQDTLPAGVATGLAWTPMGGDILYIEASQMPGSGKLLLTGQLGDVMKESAQIALSLARSRLAGLTPEFVYDKSDVHIHVPAGAIPKDGPSAGVTMLTTIASLFTHRPVDAKTAMTGEITLRGLVLPVGGIKEKVIAAHRAGIKKVILSKKNERDLKEIPEEIRQDINFVSIETVEDLLHEALGFDTPKPETLSHHNLHGEDSTNVCS